MKIVVIGAGGQGLIVVDVLLRAREAGEDVEVVALLDDDPARAGALVLGVRVAGPLASIGRVPHDAVVVAIGNNLRRREITERLVAAREELVSARHPFSRVSPGARLGEGTMISAGAIVSPGAELGRGVLLNTKASIDHDTRVGDFAHVSPGATVGARCFVGEETLVASGVTVVSGSRIGARTVVGAGSVVVRDLPDDVVAWGAPARVVRPNR
ncbi:MAG: acetyltransferase [Thermoanaerobaculia bacterium]|nr:acetyltransferase [Thermoanaerobaculia bacterium]